MHSPQDPQHNSPTPSPATSPPGEVASPIVVPSTSWLPSLVWLVPLVAALIGIGLVVKTLSERGPTITISFKSAEGLEPGKTQVKYKEVEIGSVKAIKLSKNLTRVIAEVQLKKEAEDFANKDTHFWIVRPRIGTSGVSGLGTLLSGAYIGVDAGRSQETEKTFTGLDVPPVVTGDQQGSSYTLRGESLGSVDIGSPVYYRRVQVGQVVGFSLDRDGTGITVKVFVNAPYNQYIGQNARWWHASGVDLRLDSNGFKLNTQSLATVIVGGIAFQSPPGQDVDTPAPVNTTFHLSANEADAMRDPDHVPIQVVMNFNQSLRGLSLGAAVDFRGIELGQVTSIGIDYDPKLRNFTMPVTMNIYPERLGRRFRETIQTNGESAGRQILLHLVQRGLRGQLRTGNLLTNQLYVALDFFPKAAPVGFQTNRTPLVLPTVPNTLDELQLQLADITRKLNKVPFDQIGSNLNTTLQNADKLFKRLDTQVAPEARDTLRAAKQTFATAQSTLLQQDAPLQTDVRQALKALTRTLQSLNTLADYLERHPEALLQGKPGDRQ